MTRAQLDKKMADDKKKEEAKVVEGKSDVFERLPSYQVHPCSFSTRRASADGARWAGVISPHPSTHASGDR